MTGQRDIERVLDQWFEDGPSEIADRVIDDALLTIERTTQRGGVLRLPRRFTLNGTLRLAAVALAALAVIALGVGLFNRTPATNVGGPLPSSSTPSPAASASAPVAALLPGAIVFEHFGGRLDGTPPRPNENGTGRLWIVDAGGATAHELLPDHTGSQGGLTWSADGTRIAFTELGDVERIYATDLSGTTPVLLDTGCADCDDNEPSFSPDGKQIVFRRILFGAGRVVAPTTSVIATMDLATGTVVELTTTKTTFADDKATNEYPRWSPDGTRILFYRWTNGANDRPIDSALYVVDVNGANLRKIESAPFAGDAEWSPDGSRIAFSTYPRHAEHMVGDTPAQQNVYTVAPDGTGLTQLTSDGISSAPAWTSDGRILFVRGPLNRGIVATDLWLMDADGQNQVQVTHYLDSEGQCCSFYAKMQPTP